MSNLRQLGGPSAIRLQPVVSGGVPLLRSLTGFGRRPSNHSVQVVGLKSFSLLSMTHDKWSRGPPFMYGGGETGMNTAPGRAGH